MNFLAPLYLLAGLAAAVPLLLHLWRRRTLARRDFPATRYLERAEREHSRSLRVSNLLLMVLRVLLVLAIAAAAARPIAGVAGVGHAPVALAIVLDNSLSTTAVRDGIAEFMRLRDAVRGALAQATSADRLWLVTADGRVRAGSASQLLDELAATQPLADGGDLSRALVIADGLVAGAELPARLLAIATDAQRSAWSAAIRTSRPLQLFAPDAPAPPNRSIVALAASPARWSPAGAVDAGIRSPDSVPVRLSIDDRTIARTIAPGSGPLTLRAMATERGWHALRLDLPPDAYVADDQRYAAVWIGDAPAGITRPSAGPFVEAAIATLTSAGTLARDPRTPVTVGAAQDVDALPALLTAPVNPLDIGAANRTLVRLGIPWRFGAAVSGRWTVRGGLADGALVQQRYELQRTGGRSDTVSTAGDAPWIVAGERWVLVASPLDPAATNLPVRAQFLPWLADALIARAAAAPGDLRAPLARSPRSLLHLPDAADSLEAPDGIVTPVTAGTRLPGARGVWFVRTRGRRTGAVVVQADSAENSLDRFTAATLAARLSSHGNATGNASRWAASVYAGGRARPLLLPLLVIASLLLLAEMFVVRPTRTTVP